MATLVDALGVLKNFGIFETILPFMLILAGTYAILTKYKPFGEIKGANAIIATVVALVFISVAKAVMFINLLIPAMTIFLLLLVLALLVFTFVGIKGETIAKTLQEQPAIFGILVLLFVIVIFVVFSSVVPEVTLFIQNPVLAQQLNITPTSGANPTAQAATWLMFQMTQVVLSPQILGLIAMMVVFAIAAYLITREKD
jgi:hypothetical protein